MVPTRRERTSRGRRRSGARRRSRDRAGAPGSSRPHGDEVGLDGAPFAAGSRPGGRPRRGCRPRCRRRPIPRGRPRSRRSRRRPAGGRVSPAPSRSRRTPRSALPGARRSRGCSGPTAALSITPGRSLSAKAIGRSNAPVASTTRAARMCHTVVVLGSSMQDHDVAVVVDAERGRVDEELDPVGAPVEPGAREVRLTLHQQHAFAALRGGPRDLEALAAAADDQRLHVRGCGSPKAWCDAPAPATARHPACPRPRDRQPDRPSARRRRARTTARRPPRTRSAPRRRPRRCRAAGRGSASGTPRRRRWPAARSRACRPRSLRTRGRRT